MSKSVVINIETQTQKGNVVSVCHINERMLALETSYVAQKMLMMNRELFDKISQTTKIKSGALHRQEIRRKNTNTNTVYTEVNNSYEFSEVEIARLNFKDNILQRQFRAVNGQGRKFDFDKSSINRTNKKGMKVQRTQDLKVTDRTGGENRGTSIQKSAMGKVVEQDKSFIGRLTKGKKKTNKRRRYCCKR